MTQKQKECLDFIKEFIAKHGYSPSYRTIADNLGLISLGNISRIVEVLEARGKIKRIAGKYRSIEIIDGDAFYLIQVIEEIRRKTGVGHGPMLSELADAIVNKYKGAA